MESLLPLLRWLDALPARNETLAWLAFGVVVLLAVAPAAPPRLALARLGRPHWLFAAAVVAALVAFRWPIWFHAGELNPDESQMLAGAITLRDHPVFWKYVDGTTHGPVNVYFLLLLATLGLPLDYETARIGATLLQAGSLLAAWGFLRRVAGEATARVGVLPGVAFWCFVTWEDYTHYSTELAPVALISIALWLVAPLLAQEPLRPSVTWRAALAGFALGAVPYAKLQLVPLGMAVGLAALVRAWTRRGEAPGRSVAAALAGGALAPSVIVGGFLAIFGLTAQFRISYLESNLGYVESKPTGSMDMAADFFVLIAQGHYFAWFFILTVAYSLWQGRQAWTEAGPAERFVLGLAWVLLAVGFWSVITPGRMLAHYLQLLVIPVTLLGGLHFALPAGRSGRGPRHLAMALLVFLAVTVAPQAWRRSTAWNLYAGRLAENLQARPLPASEWLLREARPGDRLAMWGWKAQVFVETGLAQGTREAHSAYQLNPTPLRSFYRDRYLRDMQRRRPEWFVDAVGPGGFGYTRRDLDAHETFPELAALVGRSYTFVGEAGDLRIYRRKPGP